MTAKSSINGKRIQIIRDLYLFAILRLHLQIFTSKKACIPKLISFFQRLPRLCFFSGKRRGYILQSRPLFQDWKRAGEKG